MYYLFFLLTIILYKKIFLQKSDIYSELNL